MPDVNIRMQNIFALADKLDTRALADYEKQLIKAYKEALKNVRTQIRKMYDKYGDTVDMKQMVQYGRLNNLERDIAAELNSMGRRGRKITTSAIQDTYRENYTISGYALESTANVKLGFGMLNADAVKAAVLNPYDRIKWPDRLSGNVMKLNQRVRESVTEGLIQGYGYEQTSRKLKDHIERNLFETQRIVRTESHRAKAQARKLAFDKSASIAEDRGLEYERVWLATLDGSTRDTHADMDGRSTNQDGVFELPGGILADGPGLTGVAALDINCRCTDIMQFKETPYKSRLDNMTDEEIDYQPYRLWAEGKNIKTVRKLPDNIPTKPIPKKIDLTTENQRLAKKFKAQQKNK